MKDEDRTVRTEKHPMSLRDLFSASFLNCFYFHMILLKSHMADCLTKEETRKYLQIHTLSVSLIHRLYCDFCNLHSSLTLTLELVRLHFTKWIAWDFIYFVCVCTCVCVRICEYQCTHFLHTKASKRKALELSLGADITGFWRHPLVMGCWDESTHPQNCTANTWNHWAISLIPRLLFCGSLCPTETNGTKQTNKPRGREWGAFR